MAEKRPLHIGIFLQADASWLGGVYYYQNLIRALKRLNSERETVRISVLSRTVLNELQMEGVHQIRIPTKGSSSILQKLIWKFLKVMRNSEDPFIEKIVIKNNIDFLYPYPGRSRKGIFASAAWIFDFQHKYLPEFFSPEEIRQRNRMFSRIADLAPVIVVSSQTAAKDFQRFFPRHFHKVQVLRFRTCIDQTDPVAEVQKTVDDYNLPEKFFMVCNQFWQHKNHLRVFESVAALKRRGVEIRVVMTGHLHDYRRPHFQDEILQAIHHHGIHKNIFILGRIPKEHYFRLMRAAAAVLQPSLFEGWSSVIEDARALGKTLVLSDIPVHREQNPPGAFYFDAKSSTALANTLKSVIDSVDPGPDLRSEDVAARESWLENQEFAKTFQQIAEKAYETQCT